VHSCRLWLLRPTQKAHIIAEFGLNGLKHLTSWLPSKINFLLLQTPFRELTVSLPDPIAGWEGCTVPPHNLPQSWPFSRYASDLQACLSPQHLWTSTPRPKSLGMSQTSKDVWLNIRTTQQPAGKECVVREDTSTNQEDRWTALHTSSRGLGRRHHDPSRPCCTPDRRSTARRPSGARWTGHCCLLSWMTLRRSRSHAEHTHPAYPLLNGEHCQLVLTTGSPPAEWHLWKQAASIKVHKITETVFWST